MLAMSPFTMSENAKHDQGFTDGYAGKLEDSWDRNYLHGYAHGRVERLQNPPKCAGCDAFVGHFGGCPVVGEHSA